MEAIKREFENYLKRLVASFKQDENNVVGQTKSGNNVGGRSKSYNAHAKDKMYELIGKDRSAPAISMKLELNKLRVKYHRILLEDYRL